MKHESGFPKYPDYKDSGIEWLGDIPTNWTAAPLKWTFILVGGSTPRSDNPDYWDGNIQWFTPADLGKSTDPYLLASQRTVSRRGLDSCSSSLVPPGALLLSTRAPIGSIGITNDRSMLQSGLQGSRG